MTNELIEFKLIDELLLSRNELISTYLHSVALQRESIKIANKIEQLIPQLNASHVDSFDIVFIKLSNRLGEHNRHRQLPAMSNLIQMSEKKLEETVTHVIDGTLWDVLFNRLGFYGWLSNKQKNEFFKICQENPKPFDFQFLGGFF